MGSASELEYQLLLVHDLGMIDDRTHHELTESVQETKKMLAALIKSLRSTRSVRAGTDPNRTRS